MKSLLISFMAVLLIPLFSIADSSEPETVVNIFSGNEIHFHPDSSGKYNTEKVTAENSGRVIKTIVSLPMLKPDVQITARLTLDPIPKDDVNVHDKWDRAGNVRLELAGQPDIEIMKFITAYGGRTTFNADVSHLAPLLEGQQTIKGFIDTWVTPAWKMTFDLIYQIPDTFVNPTWNYSLLYHESFDALTSDNNGVEVLVDIPKGLNRVMLNYLASGHCTDGTGADEFVPKDNVIYVDDVVVYRFRPWRDDCRNFRAVNPYTRRWSDGYWSSDYSRSGWCPGDWVAPVEIDLTDHLTPGKHRVRFMIEDIRGKDEDGHFGYWRVSSHLVGWKDLPVVEN